MKVHTHAPRASQAQTGLQPNGGTGLTPHCGEIDICAGTPDGARAMTAKKAITTIKRMGAVLLPAG